MNALSPLNIGYTDTQILKATGSLGKKRKTNNILSRSFGGDTAGVAGSPSGTCWHSDIELDGHFVAIRPVFRNFTAGNIVITKAAVGVTDGSVPNPGFVGNLVPITFGGNAKGTIPPLVSTKNPGLLYPDFAAIQSLAPVDGNKFIRAIFRIYFATPDGSGAGSGYTYWNHGTQSAWNAIAGQKRWQSISQAVDGIATPASFTNSGDSGNIIFNEVEALSSSDCTTIAFPGDSLVAGTGTYNATTPWAYLACKALTSQDHPVVERILGIGGSVPSQYYTHAIAALTASKPHKAFYQITSTNTPGCTTQALADEHWYYAMQFVDFCFKNNIEVGLTTGFGQNLAPGADVYLLSLQNKCRKFCEDTGISLIDTALVTSDPTQPGKLLPAFNTGDNAHMNDAGHVALANYAAGIIASSL